MTKARNDATALTVNGDEYIFGGRRSSKTSQILKRNSNVWEKGPKIPKGLVQSCSVKITDNELLFIGSSSTKKILKYDLKTRRWNKITNKKHRNNPSCIYFKSKIIVTGGEVLDYNNYIVSSNTTDVIEIGKNGSLSIRKVGDLNVARHSHGIGIINVHKIATVIVFGGNTGYNNQPLHSVEAWNDATEKWTLLPNLRLKKSNSQFGFTQVPTRLLCK